MHGTHGLREERSTFHCHQKSMVQRGLREDEAFPEGGLLFY
jgi:hypothetical protein